MAPNNEFFRDKALKFATYFVGGITIAFAVAVLVLFFQKYNEILELQHDIPSFKLNTL